MSSLADKMRGERLAEDARNRARHGNIHAMQVEGERLIAESLHEEDVAILVEGFKPASGSAVSKIALAVSNLKTAIHVASGMFQFSKSSSIVYQPDEEYTPTELAKFVVHAHCIGEKAEKLCAKLDEAAAAREAAEKKPAGEAKFSGNPRTNGTKESPKRAR